MNTGHLSAQPDTVLYEINTSLCSAPLVAMAYHLSSTNAVLAMSQSVMSLSSTTSLVETDNRETSMETPIYARALCCS